MINFTSKAPIVRVVGSSNQKVIYLSPVNGLVSIRFDDRISDESTVSKEFDYSPDGSTWANAWYPELKNIINDISLNDFVYQKLYLRVRLSFVYPDTAKDKIYVLDAVYINEFINKVTGIETIETNEVIGVNYAGGLFHPQRGSEKLNSIRRQLSKLTTKMVDIRCSYHKIRVIEDSVNVTLKTYENKELYDIKDLQITFKDGAKPDERPVMSEWAFEFDNGFEIEINKQIFRDVFGADAEPSAQDFLRLYMDDRWYEINTVFEKRAVLNNAVQWNCMLVKWEDRASVSKGDLKSKVDDFTQYIEGMDSLTLDVETRTATGETDTVTDVAPNGIEIPTAKRGNAVTNLIKAANKITAVTGIAINDEVVARYLYQTDEDILTHYNLNMPEEFNSVDDDGYSVCMWFVPSTLKNAKIFDTNAVNSLTQCTLTRDGRVMMDLTTETAKQKVITKGTTIIEVGKPYFIAVNRIVNFINGNSNRMCTVSILNQSLQVIQEIAVPETDRGLNPTTLTVYGQKSVGNIRVYKNPIARTNIGSVAMTSNPSPDTCYIIDNVTTSSNNENLGANR